MRAAATLVAGVVLWALALECRADVPLAIFSCADRDALAAVCGRVPDIVVCINDFQYQPPVITPRQGDMVAWVNVEKCADPSGSPVNIVEDLVANKIGTGCDTHHEVITFPDKENSDPQDNLDARICSPNRGIPATAPTLPGFAIDAGACGDPDPEVPLNNTNVFCHEFKNVSLQHYTCMTNPAHTVVLHGGILVLPAQAPPVPELPQNPPPL